MIPDDMTEDRAMTVAPIITGPGEYRTRDGRKAVLSGDPQHGWMMGFIEGELFPRNWEIKTSSLHPSGASNHEYSDDIVGLWPPKAEKIEP